MVVNKKRYMSAADDKLPRKGKICRSCNCRNGHKSKPNFDVQAG